MMEQFYLILVIVLFALAISDLIVGVSNDAVNFLNSAIGSKAAPTWIIFTVASLGVLVGATFSSGMMEVARKGIFHPDMFFFSEIMIIFLAVMITDIILLDAFNTFGLPTSTTVSIVFELLGAAVAVSVVKITQSGQSLAELSSYINSSKALAIISGILMSVFIAFTVGALIMYITRILFSFRYNRSINYFGSIFGGVAIAAITYFILIKGMKGSSFAEIQLPNGEPIKDWVKHNSLLLLMYSFIGWTVIMQLLKWFFKIDVLKVIVLVGTFALAMAFAGNDLVNFIGVPLAGFNSFQDWLASGAPDPSSFSMDMLKGKVGTPVYMLLISGFVMIITLITSRKARAVVKTEVNLARQTEGEERFGSSLVARTIVRGALNFNKSLTNVMPSVLTNKIGKRFETVALNPSKGDNKAPAFDMIRASCNLVVASILISIGTSLKLPLSTTYVTFMVAMGTSLADRAWDRESAVYRVSGVFTVIGGWFMTALIAFSIAAFIAWMIAISGKFMVFVFVAVAIFMVGRTYILFKKRSKAKQEEDDDDIQDASEKMIEKTKKQVVNSFINANQIYAVGIESFIKEKRSALKEAIEMNASFNKKTRKAKEKVYSFIQKLQKESMESGHCYVQIVDYQRQVMHSLNFLVEPLLVHVQNQHKPFNSSQVSELRSLSALVDEYFNFALHMVKENKFEKLDELFRYRDTLFDRLVQIEKSQIKRIKNREVNTRNSVLFFNVITETKNLILHSINLMKSQRDFIQLSNK